MFRKSLIPIWVNVLMVLLLLFMSIQVYWFYIDHAFLVEAGIETNGEPNLNVLYTTAARLLAMIVATLFVIVTQNPHGALVVLIMSIFREGQEMIIDPLYPYANSPASPAMDFGAHVVIVALEIAAFITVLRRTRQQ